MGVVAAGVSLETALIVLVCVVIAILILRHV